MLTTLSQMMQGEIKEICRFITLFQIFFYNPNVSKHYQFRQVAKSPSYPVTFSPNISVSFGSLTGMLGDERGNQTLSSTGLETPRPHFCLFHASCSHFLFCLVILLPLLPACIFWAFLLLSLSIYLSVQGFRGELWQEACPATTPAALHSSLSHFLPLRLPLVSFHRPPPPNLMHFSFFPPDFLHAAYSSDPLISYPPPSAHTLPKFSTTLIQWTSEPFTIVSPVEARKRNNNLFCFLDAYICIDSTTWLTTFQSQIRNVALYESHIK